MNKVLFKTSIISPLADPDHKGLQDKVHPLLNYNNQIKREYY